MRIVSIKLNSQKSLDEAGTPALTADHTWVRGPQFAQELVADGLLGPEGHRDLTLDHIAGSCELIGQLEIRKRF